MTTAYWFDLDGTLIGYERSFEAMLEDCLGGEQPDGVHDTFRMAIFAALEDLDKAPYERAFDVLIEEHGLAIQQAPAAATFREYELAATRLVTGAREVLSAASAHGPVGIVTNGDGRMQHAKVRRHGLDELVDEVIVSNEVGVRKPRPDIFDIARDRLPADSHVYVGDSYEEDVIGARDAGFEAVHVRNDDGPALSVDRLASLGLVLDAAADTH